MRPQDVSAAGRVRIDRPAVEEVPRRPFIADRDLTYHADGIRWTFSGGRIFADGQDVNLLINQTPDEVGFWMGIAQGLDDYRRKVSQARGVADLAKFEAVAQGLLSKILSLLKKVYDQKMTGIHLVLQNGQLVINGINIRSFLALYRIRKTDKAKRFLKGLRGKLDILLSNRTDSPDYERIRGTIETLRDEMDAELGDKETARSPRRLASPRARDSR